MSTPSGLRLSAVHADAASDAPGAAETRREPSSGAAGSAESLVGCVLGGRYLVERVIGKGGMGAVYQAEHTHMHKRMAVKVLHREMSGLPEVVARFEREAMAAGHIEHPNVAAATDFGKLDDGSFFLVLEYVEGQSLREAMGKGALDLGRALHVVRQIASALSRAHALGIVHRDLKPENVMLIAREGDADFVKILDFGIAKVPMGELAGPEKSAGPVLTRAGMVYGTPEYMAPEQALGQPVDRRADLYALGVILFEMATGTRPYEHESKVTLLGMHVTAPVPKMRERAPERGIPPALDAIVTRLLAKDAAARFADAKELAEALGTLPRDASVSSGGVVRSMPFSTKWSERALSWLDRVSKVSRQLRWRHVTPTRIVAGGVVAAAAVFATSFWLGRSTPRSTHAGADDRGFGAILLHAVHIDRTDEIVSAARGSLERADFSRALDQLSGVEKTATDRADVHLLLERAYAGLHDVREAMSEAERVLAIDANATADSKLCDDVKGAALSRDAQDEAFSLLESTMGSVGVDILYDIGYDKAGRSYPQAAARARHSLADEDVRNRASPALATLLDFRDAKSCEAKREMLPRVRDVADARALAVLQQHQSARNCGFLGLADCYPCLHHDSQLADTMAAIEQRTSAVP
jgi:serine/threonine-protein kinase